MQTVSRQGHRQHKPCHLVVPAALANDLWYAQPPLVFLGTLTEKMGGICHSFGACSFA